MPSCLNLRLPSIEAHPDVAILGLQNTSDDWSMQLEAIVAGCVVLDLKKIILDLRDAEITTPFQIACIVSAWHLLIDVGGTLLICGLSERANRGMRECQSRARLNLFADADDRSTRSYRFRGTARIEISANRKMYGMREQRARFPSG